MFLDQPYCICIEEIDFDLKGSETDAAGIIGPWFQLCDTLKYLQD